MAKHEVKGMRARRRLSAAIYQRRSRWPECIAAIVARMSVDRIPQRARLGMGYFQMRCGCLRRFSCYRQPQPGSDARADQHSQP